MEVLNLVILGFVIFSIASSLKRKTSYPNSRPAPRTTTRSTKPIPVTTPWERNRTNSSDDKVYDDKPLEEQPYIADAYDTDPFKEIELANAEGKEGEWGDEGRSDYGIILEDNKIQKETKPLKKTGTKNVTVVHGENFNIKKADLIKGVIMSEVLSPPRAVRSILQSRPKYH